MRDVIVIGAGPAGLAAANYLLRKRLDFLVVSNDLGGKTSRLVRFPDSAETSSIRPTAIIEEFKKELAAVEKAHRFCHAERIVAGHGTFTVTLRDSRGDRTSEHARSVIVATGTTQRHLNVPGESEFAGKALGYSSISYSHLLVNKRVFLLGDSQRTVDDARELANHAREVLLLLERGSRYRELFEQQLSGLSNVTVLKAEKVLAFEGDDYARRAVIQIDVDERRTLEADAFFIQMEPKPNSDIVEELASTDEEGRIVVDMRNRTTQPGLMAAGDVTNVGFEQILVALGEGSKAALTAYQQVSRKMD